MILLSQCAHLMVAHCRLQYACFPPRGEKTAWQVRQTLLGFGLAAARDGRGGGGAARRQVTLQKRWRGWQVV
jgi:hypothetical protein